MAKYKSYTAGKSPPLPASKDEQKEEEKNQDDPANQAEGTMVAPIESTSPPHKE